MVPGSPLPADSTHIVLVVCAWCTPKLELVALSRKFPRGVSHSICPPCTARFEQGLTS